MWELGMEVRRRGTQDRRKLDVETWWEINVVAVLFVGAKYTLVDTIGCKLKYCILVGTLMKAGDKSHAKGKLGGEKI
jgi:hypothetical protein